MIKFNKPYITGKESEYMQDVLASGHLAGDGKYTKLCNQEFERKFGFRNVFLTTSGTDALEMSALLMGIKEGDEIIMPSYTFVSTANAFVLRGARIIFADSLPHHPNIDHTKLESLITPRTKGIVVVHYGGVACDMDAICALASKHDIMVVEDAAHSIDSYYNGKPLGSIGNFGAFSFHETKNIVCGEGGMLVVNDERFRKPAEIVREKGTNRTAFFRGDIDKYGWVDVGSSFLSSEILAAFLFAQLESIDVIQQKRINVWTRYQNELAFLADKGYGVPVIPSFATNNAHVFHLICPSLEVRSGFIAHLAKNNIKAVFHYQPLHLSSYFTARESHIPDLPNAARFGDTLVRLPLFASLTEEEQTFIIGKIKEYVNG